MSVSSPERQDSRRRSEPRQSLFGKQIHKAASAEMRAAEPWSNPPELARCSYFQQRRAFGSDNRFPLIGTRSRKGA